MSARLPSAGLVLLSAPEVPTLTVKVPAVKLAVERFRAALALLIRLPSNSSLKSSLSTAPLRLRSMKSVVWLAVASK